MLPRGFCTLVHSFITCNKPDQKSYTYNYCSIHYVTYFLEQEVQVLEATAPNSLSVVSYPLPSPGRCYPQERAWWATDLEWGHGHGWTDLWQRETRTPENPSKRVNEQNNLKNPQFSHHILHVLHTCHYMYMYSHVMYFYLSSEEIVLLQVFITEVVFSTGTKGKLAQLGLHDKNISTTRHRHTDTLIAHKPQQMIQVQSHDMYKLDNCWYMLSVLTLCYYTFKNNENH